MIEESAAAFWSYTRADDELDSGRIHRLAESLKSEFALITGRELQIFVDRTSIQWGDEWRARIDAALRASTFFIPIVTPRYFQSQECRNELLTFAGHATSLGVTELLLPILYVNVDGLTEESDDEAVSQIARMQREDWRELRLAEEQSADSRQAVNRLARRLAEVDALVTQRAEAEVDRPPPPGNGEEAPGPLDILAEGFEALETVSATLTRIGEHLQALGERAVEATEEMAESDRHGRGFAGRLNVARRFAQDLEPASEELEREAGAYTADLVKIDPAILYLIREVTEDPSVLADNAEVTEFLGHVRGGALSGRGAAESMNEFVGSLESVAQVSRVLRPPVRRIQRAVRSVADGQAILGEWERLVAALGIEPIMPADAEEST